MGYPLLIYMSKLIGTSPYDLRILAAIVQNTSPLRHNANQGTNSSGFDVEE